jgi:hypothetical protein
MKVFKTETWLNPKNHPSTGSVVCYHGKAPWKKHKKKLTFLQISDCSGSIRLHRTDYDTKEDFASKLENLEMAISEFRKYLLTN